MPLGEVVWEAPGHVGAIWRNVLIQIRTGEMTLAALTALETAAQLARARIMSQKSGLLAVVAATAPPSMGEVAQRQRAITTAALADPRIHVCAVLEGDALGAVVQRTLLRTFYSRRNHRAIRGTVAEGAEWLLASLESRERADELAAFVESIRPK